ncbi:MAG: DNA-protecting protein DprA, partial [SAR202 cluster bacterium]|nr:DNA-protecting protein DprA [SAR202 cluster bacterium]
MLESILHMDDKELKYWIAFNRVSRVGRARMALLEGHFGSLSRAWEADSMELAGAGLDRGTVRHIANQRPKIDPDRELEALRTAGVKAVT